MGALSRAGYSAHAVGISEVMPFPETPLPGYRSAAGEGT